MPEAQPLTILLVEDDDGHAQLVERNLRRGGLINRIDRVADGRAGLDYLLRQGPYADRPMGVPVLVLLDIKLPKLSGIEMLRRMKADERLRRLPAIMLTTTDDPREINKCYELGCSAYLTKPVDYDKFVAMVRNLGLFLSVVTVPAEGGELSGATGV